MSKSRVLSLMTLVVGLAGAQADAETGDGRNEPGCGCDLLDRDQVLTTAA
jgi:hypothetical protein